MKVLFSHYLLDDDHPAARMVYEIAAMLCARGHEVLVHRSAGARPGTVGRRCKLSDSELRHPRLARPLAATSTPLPHVPSRASSSARTFPTLRARAWFMKAILRNAPMARRDAQAIQDFGPDVVLARQDAYCVSMAWAAHLAGVPLVTYADAPVAYESRTFNASERRWHPPGLVETVEAWTLRHSKAVVTVSRPAARRLERYGLTVPIYVVPNGVDPKRFAPMDANERQSLRLRLGITAPKVVAFAGTFKRFHGTDRLGEMILALAHRNDVQWLLIGDGPERAALEQTLSGRAPALFPGRWPAAEIGRVLSVADVAVAPHPPLNGDFYFCPLKVLEYAAAGCAVVASRQGDIPEILGHGRAGEVISGCELGPWIASVSRLLDDDDRRQILGRAARERVLSRYTWAHTAERVEAVLIQALMGPATNRERLRMDSGILEVKDPITTNWSTPALPQPRDPLP